MTYWVKGLKQEEESQMTKYSSLAEYKCTTEETKESQVTVRVEYTERACLKINAVLCV